MIESSSGPTYPIITLASQPDLLLDAGTVTSFGGRQSYPVAGPFPAVSWPQQRFDFYVLLLNTAFSGMVDDDGSTLQVGPYIWSKHDPSAWKPYDNGLPPDPAVIPQIQEYVWGVLSNGGLVRAGLTRIKNTRNQTTAFLRVIGLDGPKPGVVVANATCAAFDPQVGEHALLKFDVLPIGITPPFQINAWTVQATQSNTTVKVFTPGADSRGPGVVTPKGDGVHVEIPWDAKDSSGRTVAGNFDWQIVANVTNVAGSGQPGAAGTANATVHQLEEGSSITIVSAQPNPESFSPAEGEKAVISYDVVTSGLTSNMQLNTQVVVRDANNQVFHTFPMRSGPPVTNLHETTPAGPEGWDGKNAQGEVISGDFSWVVCANATSTVAGPGGGNTSTATNVTKSGSADVSVSLVVQAGGKDRARLEKGKPSRALLAKVYKNNEDWVITAKGLSFDGGRPDAITAHMQGLQSKTSQDAELKWSVPEQAYVGNFSKTIDLVKPQQSNPSFTAIQKLETNPGSPAKDILKSLLGSVSSMDLGLLGEDLHFPETPGTVLTNKLLEEPNLAITDKGNLEGLGFEAIRVSLEHASLKSSPAVLVKVQHPADTLILDLHGEHSNGLVVLNEFVSKPPLSLPVTLVSYRDFQLANGVQGTWTLISLACDILDLHDYNNFFSSKNYPKGYNPADGIISRLFSGQDWYGLRLTNSSSKKVLMLGYNAKAPTDTVASVGQAYLAKVKAGQAPALAWLEANREKARSDDYAWCCLNACAYDEAANYYYIPYKTPSGKYSNRKVPKWRIPPPKPGDNPLPGEGVFKVPAARWNDEAKDWEEIPQEPLGGGTPRRPYLADQVSK